MAVTFKDMNLSKLRAWGHQRLVLVSLVSSNQIRLWTGSSSDPSPCATTSNGVDILPFHTYLAPTNELKSHGSQVRSLLHRPLISSANFIPIVVFCLVYSSNGVSASFNVRSLNFLRPNSHPIQSKMLYRVGDAKFRVGAASMQGYRPGALQASATAVLFFDLAETRSAVAHLCIPLHFMGSPTLSYD